jgi:hypothetical protein
MKADIATLEKMLASKFCQQNPSVRAVYERRLRQAQALRIKRQERGRELAAKYPLKH